MAQDTGLGKFEGSARERLGEDAGIIQLGRALGRCGGAVLRCLARHGVERGHPLGLAGDAPAVRAPGRP